MNVWFCLWLASRALRGDRVELMVHEPYLEFGLGPVRYTVMALVHRVMTMILLAASRRVWMSIPAWEERLRPYALRRSLPMEWLPVPGSISATGITNRRSRRQKYATDEQCLVGHFGTYGKDVSALLAARLPAILDDASQPALLLIGAGSERFRHALLARNLRWASRVHATDYVPPDDLGAFVALCDVFVQPYPDGISSRRTSAMTCLAGGRAVVTTSGHLTEPLWAASDAVLIADVQDPEGFVAAALHLIADANARHRVGEQGKRLYAERFSVDRTVSALRAA
jgi:glycosyltransferase involved in cell wall biosynthesis